MRYWEPFGLGDGRPWAAYLVLRGWGPALAAVAAIGLSRELPVFVPGIVECVGLVAVMFAFRLRPIADLTAASRARAGAFAATLSVGVPSVVWQLGLLSGPVMLAATRSPAAAGMLAIGVRIVTGVNQLCGIVATSLFPATASGGGRRVAARGAWTVVLVAGAAVSLFLLAPEWIVAVVAGPGADEAVTPSIVAVGASGAVGLLLMITMSEIALQRERTLVVSLVLSTSLALVLYGVAAATGDALVGAWALVVGQLTGVALVARRVGGLRGPASATFALAGAAAFVAAFEPARLPLGVVVSRSSPSLCCGESCPSAPQRKCAPNRRPSVGRDYGDRERRPNQRKHKARVHDRKPTRQERERKRHGDAVEDEEARRVRADSLSDASERTEQQPERKRPYRDQPRAPVPVQLALKRDRIGNARTGIEDLT